MIDCSTTQLSKELPLSAYESEVYHLVQVDRRVTYVKFIDSDDLEIHKSVKSVNKNISYKDKLKLIDLAIQSGIHSRFNIDKNIGKEKFEEMYRLWMINSLNYKIAKEVLTFIENDKLMGVITLMGERDEAYIGIIAVEHTFRGRGIGEILMKSAEKRLSNLGYNSIKVVTQENNIPACRLYEKCGYVVENVEYFYHIWKK